MTDKILTERIGQAGVITLNRPQAINALDLEMIDAISAALEDFLADDAITLILFEGAGERGFCAGGDVGAVRRMVLEGDFAGPEAFFAREYAMNLRIAKSPKPIVVLAHGAIMGGGIGIAGHADFRFARPDAKFAMPEAAIGLHCDTGANAILAKTQRHRALAFCMVGRPVAADAALALGLTDCAIEADARDHIRDGIIEAAGAEDVRGALTLLMQGHAVNPEESDFVALADGLRPAFAGDNAAEIVAALEDQAQSEAEKAYVAAIGKGCPTTLEVIVQSLIAARHTLDIRSVLERDLRLSMWLIAQPDFAEGVRAVLVDKDRNPAWSPATLEEVDVKAIRALVAG